MKLSSRNKYVIVSCVLALVFGVLLYFSYVWFDREGVEGVRRVLEDLPTVVQIPLIIAISVFITFFLVFLLLLSGGSLLFLGDEIYKIINRYFVQPAVDWLNRDDR